MKLEEIEVDYDAPNWHEQMFKNSLVSVLKKGEDEKANLLFSHYLTSITTFLENSYHNGSLIDGSIIELVQTTNIVLGYKVFGTQNKTHQNAMRIGLIVELLFQKGLPRSYSIPAVSEWLDIKERTVRSHNEEYRKKWGKEYPINGLNLAIVERMSFFGATPTEDNPSIAQIFEENPNFPNNHPKALKAFTECLKFLKNDDGYKTLRKNISSY